MASSFDKKRSKLILSRTPLRISFAGGGTDLADFFEQDFGAVLSTAIDKFIYVTVKSHGVIFGEQYRFNYSDTETPKTLDEIQNKIIRECLRLAPVDCPLYISTVADLPASTGLGSSSAFAVGLLNALHAFRGEEATAAQLAEEAYQIEALHLKRPVGKQDQYAAAFGGLNYFKFQANGRVTLEPLTLSGEGTQELFDHLLLFWTNITRDAATVLSEQKDNTPQNNSSLVELRQHASDLRSVLFQKFDPIRFGTILDQTWQLKRGLATQITNSKIDFWYEKAKAAGAIGGKLCGAGGGGFLCMVVEPKKKEALRQAMSDLTEVRISYEPVGSKILFEQ